MNAELHAEELEIRRLAQELAVAWRNGRAAFVLDALAGEAPLRSALVATLVHESLARWDPYDSRLPNGFRRALQLRSHDRVAPEEVAELEREYRRAFGCRPPLPALPPDAEPFDGAERSRLVDLHLRRIRAALASGRPLVRERPSDTSPRFLRRRRPARSTPCSGAPSPAARGAHA